MTEKEKMQRHMLYDANYDPELQQERINCKELCYDYNALRPSRTEEQTALLKRLLGKTEGAFTIIELITSSFFFLPAPKSLHNFDK